MLFPHVPPFFQITCGKYPHVKLLPAEKNGASRLSYGGNSLSFGEIKHDDMKRTTTGRLPSIILIIILLSLATGVKAQRVTDSGYRTVATIKSDGTIQDSSYKTIGYIKSDGKIQDASYRTIGYLKDNGTVQDDTYRTVGYIKDDGKVQDSSYRTIGYVKKDGTVQDASYKTIGYAKDIPMRWAAFYFFFRK